MILKKYAEDIAKAFTRWGLWQGGVPSDIIKSKILTFENLSIPVNSWTLLTTIDIVSLGGSVILGVVPLGFSATPTTSYSITFDSTKTNLYILCTATSTINKLEVTLLYK